MPARDRKRIPPWVTGLIGVVVVVFGFYLGFAKSLPFTGHGYELKAVFSSAQEIRVKSPVRIAGVDVGKVTKISHLTEDGEGQQAAVVTMEIKDDGLPIKQDATLQIRPRLFLEGNLFVDLHPGTPSAPELKDGSMVPLNQTSTSVQVDQVLTSLQAPVRADLQSFLVEFGNSLEKYGGGEGLRTAFKTSPSAFKYTSQVSEALLGEQPGDLTGLIVNLDSFVKVLDDNKVQLADLVGNLGTVLDAFGQEDQALQSAIFTLPQVLSVGQPALVELNAALPQLRAFAREALPGVKSAKPAIKAANPLLAQLRGLVQPRELPALTSDLVPTVPQLANLSRLSLPFLEQARLVSSCFNNVIIPWGNLTVPNSDGTPSSQVYKNTGYALAGLGGESRDGDANGEWIRTGLTAGTNTVSYPDPDPNNASFGIVGDLLGAEPSIGSSRKTPFNPDAPCENQDLPDLRASVAAPPQLTPTAGSRSGGNNLSTLPDGVKTLLNGFTPILNELNAAKEESGARGAADQAAAQSKLRDFLKNTLPQYRGQLKDLLGQ
jgi:phospholipid/cholesterol/gamma-HCH transport system substrate-binding protein